MPDKIDFHALRFIWDVIQSGALLSLFIWTVIDRKRQSNTKGIDQLRKEHRTIDRRVQKLESSLERLPTHDEITAIKVQMASLTTQLRGMDHKLETIHQFLLNSKRSQEDRP